jgi:bacillopeptidase F
MKRVSLFLLALGLCTWSIALRAQNYVVLFKQSEVAVASLEHKDYVNLLQNANAKDVGSLKKWMNSHGVRSTTVNDLWLVRGAVVDVTASAAKQLKTEPWVSGVFVDQNRKLIKNPGKITVFEKSRDVDLSNLWGLENAGVYQLRKEMPSITGAGVRVGVVDTGVQSGHPEFFYSGTPKPVFHDFVNSIPSPYDDAGHGTHTAGTIAGSFTGVAPGASLYMAKGLTGGGWGFDSQLLSAMQWMVCPTGDPTSTDYPQIVSNSWGGDIPDGMDIAEFAPYELAIQAWINAGIVPIFAAGNSGQNPNGFPGGLPEPIAVGAIGVDNTVADFSSRGPNIWKIGQMFVTLLKPDVSAPGVDIVSAYPGNKYAMMSGTPHVAGIVALMLQANPKLTFAQVKGILLASSQVKTDVNYGYGIVNAYTAVKMAIGGTSQVARR